ncbi:MAG: mRNA splicing protein [Sarcosagium campestre]|nr:MAG: mRNA splicing protein [Sarcosagium campestre]
MPPPKPPPDVSASAKERNEYIPSYISKKPFWVPDDGTSSTGDYLDHQRLQRATPDQSKWYDRGKRLGPAATKFRKGACENCGSMAHKTKECLSRPRKAGARWTGKDIQADEVIEDVQLGWDAKRDRWNGYDASEYRAVIEDYAQLEELRRKDKKTTALNADGTKKLLDGNEEDEDEEDDNDDAAQDKYAEESEMGRQQTKGTRQLRIREDTAKYLLNLDLDSAKYDPKTRTMVDSGATADQAAALVAEENFERASGDAAEFEQAQRYAWEAQERGESKQHMQANPTSGEYFRRKAREEALKKREAHRKALLDRYGGQEHTNPSPLRAVAAVTENERYVEYDDKGLIKGAPKTKVKSKYPEDVLLNNHASVWGSWWRDFAWGYACCHSTVKNSYCTGEEGRRAFEEAEGMRTGGALDAPDADDDEKIDGGKRIEWKAEVTTNGNHVHGIAHKVVAEPAKAVVVEPAKKRTLEEMKGGVTEEELDLYRRKRTVADDPMAMFMATDELLPR